LEFTRQKTEDSILMLRRGALALVLVSAGVALHAQGEVIDRVMAVVAGQVITLSDVDGAIALGLVSTSQAQDPRQAALQQLIERELELREVRRYLPPEPDEREVEQRLQLVRQRFSSPEEFKQALAQSGIDETRLRENLRDDLRIRAYLNERFAGFAQPTEEELLAYYTAHRSEYIRDGSVPPFADVREIVRQQVENERRRLTITEWLAGLRRRTEVTELYPPR
jgi:parvulin-like peptidyl-prolyl isomerase